MTRAAQVLAGPPPLAGPPGREGRAGGVLLLVVTSVLWSLSGVAVKRAGMPSLAFAFYRSLAAAAVMGAAVPLFAGRSPDARWMGLSALVYTAVVSLLITAMTRSTAAAGILLQYTGPVFCALFAWALQGRAIDRRTLAAMVIATAGIAVMVLGGGRGGGWVGPGCGLLSGVAFGALILILEKIDRLAGGHVNPAKVVFVNNLGAAIVLLPLALHGGALAVRPWQLAIVGATGAVQLALPYILFQLALRRVRPVEASLLILLEPVLNPVWVAMLTAERPDAATVIGGAAILAAMAIEATKKERG